MTGGERRLMDFQTDVGGGFFTLLFKAVFKADHVNLAKLRKGFPEEVESVVRWQNEVGYAERLTAEYKGGK